MLARGGAAALGLPWWRLWQPVARVLSWVMARPVWLVLGVLLLAQWSVVGVVAAIAQHNGLIYFTGGDDTWYWTSAWVLAHGHVPQGVIGYEYSFMLAPLARVAGTSIVAGIPLVIAFNMLVLWPIALFCIYGIAKRLGGRGFAYLATLAWTVFPLAAIPYFYGRYHARLISQNLPSALGLITTGEFPSLVALLTSAYFTTRALSERTARVALFAGATAGLAAAIKPANLIFLPAPVLALLVARRFRATLMFGLATLPTFVGLMLWKYRGLGYVPAFQQPVAVIAAGFATPVPLASLPYHRYLHVDWQHLRDNMYYIREFTWSLRMITWALVAGLIGLARRSRAIAVLFGGWLAGFIIVKGASAGVNVKDGSFFRYMVPVFPAFFIGLMAIVLLIPGFLRRHAIADSAYATTDVVNPRLARIGLVALNVLVFAPLVAFVLFRPLVASSAATVPDVDQYVPANAFPLSAVVQHGNVQLQWPRQSANHVRVGYAIFRMTQDGVTCRELPHAAARCSFFSDPSRLELIPTAWTRADSFRDRPGPGAWTYRVAATVTSSGPISSGNFFQLSSAVNVDVRT